jgi:hypothetical protein
MVLTTLLAVGCADDTAQSASAAATAPSPPVPVAASLPPPPPPPSPSSSPVISLAVEFPDGTSRATDVDDNDCPGRNMCDWYMIGPYVDAGFRKLDLPVRTQCKGANHDECDVVAIGEVANSKSGRWVMFRNGHRNTYPYNHILRESLRGTQPSPGTEQIAYRFLPLPN